MTTDDKDWVSDEDLALLNRDSMDSHPRVGNHMIPGNSGLTPHTTSGGYEPVTKYPWLLWLNGALHTAAPGKDFAATPTQFQTFLGNTVRRKGLYLRSSIQVDRSIIFQVFPTKEARDAAWSD